jgi:hypothetical protein
MGLNRDEDGWVGLKIVEQVENSLRLLKMDEWS